MKTKKTKGHSPSRVDSKPQQTQLIAKAATAEKLAVAARELWRTLKTEQKHARKAFRQAKKAAKLARKKASVGLKALKAFAKKMAGTHKRRATKAAVRKAKTVRSRPSRRSGSEIKRRVDDAPPVANPTVSIPPTIP